MSALKADIRRPVAGTPWVPLLGALVTASTVASAMLTMAAERGAGTKVLGLAGQLGMLAFFLLLGARGNGSWSSPPVVTAVAWFVLFTLPCLVYAIDPGLLRIPFTGIGAVSLDSLQLVNLALAATILAWMSSSRALRRSDDVARRVSIAPLELRGRRCLLFGALGVLACAFLLTHAGGVGVLVSHPDQGVRSNSGLTYVIGLAMCLKFATGMPLLAAWSRGRRASRLALVVFVLAVGAIGVLLSARGLIVVGIAQFFVLRTWLGGVPRGRNVVLLLIVGTVVIVFGLGAVKRYGSYRDQHHKNAVSLPAYMVKRAPGEAVDAYVNNYVDTVRLIAMARALVPHRAPYEPRYQVLHVLLHPIPGPLRPTITRNPLVKRVLEPGGGVYAVPLIASAYLALGAIGVALASLVLGWLVGRLERWLRPVRRSPGALVALACATVGVPLVMRSGVPEGLAFAVVDGVFGALVAWLATTRPTTRPAAR